MSTRTNEEARARIPMSADQVKAFIVEMDAKNKSKPARIRMAEAAISHGNITPEGKDIWRAYLKAHA
jgi:hypothetical protein